MTYGTGGPGLPLLVPQVTLGLPSEGAPGGPTRAVPFPSGLTVQAQASSALGQHVLAAPEASELGHVLQVTVVELVSAALSFVVVIFRLSHHRASGTCPRQTHAYLNSERPHSCSHTHFSLNKRIGRRQGGQMALEPWAVNVAKLQLQSSLLVTHVPLMCPQHSRASDKQGLAAGGAAGERPPLSLAETRDTQTPEGGEARGPGCSGSCFANSGWCSQPSSVTLPRTKVTMYTGRPLPQADAEPALCHAPGVPNGL